MKTEETKALTNSIKELAEDCAVTTNLVATSVANSTGGAKKLWKSGDKSLLIKAGVALIVCPEPFVSDILGTSLVVAGTVQG